jgi:vesicle-associated membrane protein 7
MSLLYAVVSRGQTIIAEYTLQSTSTTNASQVATLVLAKISPSEPSKLTYIYGHHLVHYVVVPSADSFSEGIIFLCISSDTESRRIPFLFLKEVQTAFEGQFPPYEIASAPPYGLNSFAGVLREKMQWANDGAQGADKGKLVREEMDAVKDVMVQNIERVLERGERIDLLVNKTDHMNQTAFAFRQRSTVLRYTVSDSGC